jgi:hypothetical protein
LFRVSYYSLRSYIIPNLLSYVTIPRWKKNNKKIIHITKL